MSMSRRQFLSYLGAGTVALTAVGTGLPIDSKAAGSRGADHLFGHRSRAFTSPFRPIEPTSRDELVLPRGYTYEVIAAYGDDIGNGETFGFNNDLTIFFPIDGSSERGLLWVNHEYTNPLFVQGQPGNNGYNAGQIEKILYHQGGSIIEVYRAENGAWRLDKTSSYNRRVTGLTPNIRLTGPAKGSKAVNGAGTVTGTFANCSGGKTLWNTVLTCEENYEYTASDAGLDATHYGWVVEVDPFDANAPIKKHTALGRFHHENTAMGLSADNRVVVYMGDDDEDCCVYKFVSKGTYDPAKGKANSRLLEEGTLYAANLSRGRWEPLDVAQHEELKKEYGSNDAVMVEAVKAAKIVGGTPTDRPEDVEIHPYDGSLFIAHTNNSNHGNMHGHITRIVEQNNDLGALSFHYEIFAAGGPQSGFSAPDNLTFDSAGHLWTVTDISSSSQGTSIWEPFQNNGLFLIPTSGSQKGEALQFASGPVESELTGPWFTPDERTLFLSVQHPGEVSESRSNLTSHWPNGGNDIPRPAVVAITGFLPQL